MAFEGLRDRIPTLQGCGVKRGIFTQEPTVGDIFDRLWKDCSEQIVTTSKSRGSNIEVKDINLLLASTLVMSLTPQPTKVIILSMIVKAFSGICGCNSTSVNMHTKSCTQQFTSAIESCLQKLEQIHKICGICNDDSLSRKMEVQTMCKGKAS